QERRAVRPRGPVERWKVLRQEIHDKICAKTFNPERGAFTQHYGADTLDASTLMIPLVGFLPASDPRVVGTVAAIERDLMVDGFVRAADPRRGGDGLPVGEAGIAYDPASREGAVLFVGGAGEKPRAAARLIAPLKPNGRRSHSRRLGEPVSY